MSDTEQKQLIRRTAYLARAAQPHKDQISRQAIERLVALPEYRRADVVMWYVDCRSELRTRPALLRELATQKRIVVPYCTEDEHGEHKLGLWLLQSMDELVTGKWRIMEPPKDRWDEVEREVKPEELDFVVVPGVAYDCRGGRVGNGQGYYDRLLRSVRPDCYLVGPCYECQLVSEIPMLEHDVYMNRVVTELGSYAGQQRLG